MAYATLAQLKAVLKIDVIKDDTLLQRYLDTAQSIIDGPGPIGCNRRFEALTDETRYFDSRTDIYRGELFIPNDEFCQFTQIVNGDGTIIPISQCTFQPRNHPPYYSIRLKNASWVGSDKPIAITGRWAFSITPPPLITEATLQLAAYYYKLKDSSTYDVVANNDMGTMTIPKGAPKSAMMILDGFRRIV